MQPQRTRNPTADIEAAPTPDAIDIESVQEVKHASDWLKRLLSAARLGEFEKAFRGAQCVDEEDIRAMGRGTLAELGLNSVQAKRLQRTLAPPPGPAAAPAERRERRCGVGAGAADGAADGASQPHTPAGCDCVG